MGNHEPTTDLAAICEEVGRVLYQNGQHHSCIIGSALLTKVLHRMEYSDAFPLTVEVRMHNRAFQQWVGMNGGIPDDEASAVACNAAGGATICIGSGAEESADRWAGHLVVVVPKYFGACHALCDLTIEQANRPEWEVVLPPMLCLEVNDDFVAGKSPLLKTINGIFVIYQACPEDHSYSEGGDWLAMTGLDEAAAYVVSRLKRAQDIGFGSSK